jgi:hypothetical protein
MPGRKVESAADARACLEAVAASGLSRRAWAAANGIDGRSLHVWELNLARRSRNASEAPLSPVRFVELVAAAPSAALYRIVVGHVTIEVDEGFSSEGLGRLLRVVTACSP